MGTVARQHLNTYIMYWRGTPSDTSQPIFLTLSGKPVVQSSVKQMFARLKQVAGITDKRISAHTCRHWFAVTCIKSGMPILSSAFLLVRERGFLHFGTCRAGRGVGAHRYVKEGDLSPGKV